RTHRACVVNRPEIYRPRFTVIRIDNRYTGVTQRGVDGKHAHYSNLRIARRAFNPESVRVEYRQISERPLYSRRNVERFAEAGDAERASALRDDYPGADPFSFDRFFILRYDERVESNRDSGFARSWGSFFEFSNSRQADCESVSTASRAGLDATG